MYKQKTYVYGKVYKGIYLIFFLISLIKQKRVTNIVTGFVQWLLAKSHFPGASKPFNFILVKLNDCLNWTMKLEQLIIEENSAMFRRLSRVIYSNAFVQYLYTTIPTALSNNVVFSRIINALFMLMIRSKLLLFKGKAKVAEKLEELYTAASETPNSRIQRKIYAFLSMVFYSMSTRHVMYIWYGWLKLESLTIYSAIGLAIFGCNRFLLVDIYVFLSGFMHLYESTQIYYEIPENLNRAAELNEFLKKITFKKIYNTNKRANSMPDLTDNRSATRYY
ncbi:hypothetical protein ECANGB1_1417 [Enterospora canceri]|uniref:Uncharacterized protein n=1 Tax=Enterospora canceri TaxID=1081671 RepID=A0A1Y1S7B4_9MICR|nr:hypothetical protein ECANGB1_1417 [Enterospora canceri]